MPGALDGITIVEIAGIGPAPFCGMMLADHGAKVIRIVRPGPQGSPSETQLLDTGRGTTGPDHNLLLRSRQMLAVDLKSPGGVGLVKRLVRDADGLIEGMRPGVMEGLGLGPETLLASNPRLSYGRMTGWGQDGPLAQRAGHDINYIGLSGALHAMGPRDAKPMVPLNLVGDFGGGGMMLAFGMLAAILSARSTGRGQVVDCAMVDGAAIQMSLIWSLYNRGAWVDERGANLLDGGAFFYDTYECGDRGYLAVGPLEAKFYRTMVGLLGLSDDVRFGQPMNSEGWQTARDALRIVFAQKPRDAWLDLFEGHDVCVTPVLSMAEAWTHPHNVHRATFLHENDSVMPAPAPRFSKTPAVAPTLEQPPQDSRHILSGAGFTAEEIAGFVAAGTIEPAR